jgi:hypothetical protein
MKNILTPFKYKNGYLGVGLRGMNGNTDKKKHLKFIIL